ncbi:MAG: APC family permease [Solirubrobacterales bacterium]
MLTQFRRWLFGRKLETSRLSDEQYTVLWGLPILASDAISSVAYAVEEILWVMIPLIGLGSFIWMPRIAGAIILLLLILIFSYRQVVQTYPAGGGAYIVAKENLGDNCSLIAGAALSIDYVLTVAVSISAGTAAITSAFPQFFDHRVAIAVVLILLVALGNLRGLKESSRLFSIPTYAFMIGVLIMIFAGVFRHSAGTVYPPPAGIDHPEFGTGLVSIFLVLKAFSSGCAALTGVEAISDAVPNFKDPPAHNAKIAYFVLAIFVMLTFGGVAYLANLYHAVPSHQMTIMAQLAEQIFGRGPMFYALQTVTALILVMAANTAFAGFPTLLSVIAQDRYVPRQFAMRGHRLNFNNGITILALVAIVLVVVFKGSTHSLIPLYAIGVFTSFTLAQTGLFVRWLKEKPEGWRYKAVINGVGSALTLVAVVILGWTKFKEGAWIVAVIVPVLVILMKAINGHYKAVATQLDIPNDCLGRINLNPEFRHHVIIPIDSLNAMVVKALRYARSMTPDVEAFHVEIYPGEADKLRAKWQALNTDIPLIIKFSPFREVVGPMVKYIDSEEHASRPGDEITVLLPQFFVSKWWQMILHNNTSLFIANALFSRRDITVTVLPFYLEDLGFRGNKPFNGGNHMERCFYP